VTDNNPVQAFGAWSNNTNIQSRCSSGGIGFEIGGLLIEEGYEALGVRYDPVTNRAEHFIATTVEEFMPSVGSKYIPSFTTDALEKLDRSKKYFFVGTPCQVDSLRRYIRLKGIEKNFILLDFFCHGVPSLNLWDKYYNKVRSKIGDISFVSWRNKTTGWHDSWSINADKKTSSILVDWHDSYNLKIREEKHLYSSRLSQGDMFYRFFLRNLCLNECCYSSCKYKLTNSAADIRIGDFWGKKYENDNKGVSGVLVFTDSGKETIARLCKTCTFEPAEVSDVLEGQLKHNVQKVKLYSLIKRALCSPMSLSMIYNTVFLASRVLNRIHMVFKSK